MVTDFENLLYAFSQSEKSYRVQCMIITAAISRLWAEDFYKVILTPNPEG